MSKLKSRKVKKFLKLVNGSRFNLKYWDWNDDHEDCYFYFDKDCDDGLLVKLNGPSPDGGHSRVELCFNVLSDRKPKLRFFKNKQMVFLLFPTNLSEWEVSDGAFSRETESENDVKRSGDNEHDHMLIFTFLRSRHPTRDKGWQFNFVITNIDFNVNVELDTIQHSGHGGGGRD